MSFPFDCFHLFLRIVNLGKLSKPFLWSFFPPNLIPFGELGVSSQSKMKQIWEIDNVQDALGRGDTLLAL